MTNGDFSSSGCVNCNEGFASNGIIMDQSIPTERLYNPEVVYGVPTLQSTPAESIVLE